MIRLLFFSLLLAVTAQATPGPIRVLFIGRETPDHVSGKRCHVLMRDLGRDAIWFDFEAAADAMPVGDRLNHYDVVVSDGIDIGGNKSSPIPVLRPAFPAKEDDAAFVAKVKSDILAVVSKERRAEYDAFLAQREPEKRETRPTVANYEKRKKPITFQFPMSVKGSMERTQVPADCELKLFASEPDITKPIAMAWDERGRCWVAETRDYPHGVVENGEGHDDIKICEDTDGDGQADKFTVFADKLNIPTGLVLVNGGVIVSQPPRFLFLKDTNGDDKADVRKEIFTGWGIKDTHAQASNLHYGFDSWLYGCVGYSGFDGQVGGETKQFSMGTYRFKADGSALEFLHQFTNNAWGHSMNDAGDQFGGTANGAPLFFGGIPASAYPKGMNGMSAKKINEVDQCHTITPNFRQVDVFGGYTAAAGSNFIDSPALPARFQGCAMICEPTMKTVSLMKVVPDGAGYKAKDAFNLCASSDEWNSPVHAEVGPDGAVWIADFQNFIIQHNPTPSKDRAGYDAKTGVGGAHENVLRDHERGRIYRVYAKGAQPAVMKPSLDGPTQWSRLTAQRLAVANGTHESYATHMSQPGSAAIRALWTLSGLKQLDEATHRAALLAKDAKLRRNAIRALGIDKKSQELFFGAGVFSDPDLCTRLAAFVKLSEFETTVEIKHLVTKLAADSIVKGDEWLTEAARLLVKTHKAQAFKEGTNLLVNGDLEKIEKGLPFGWTRRDYGKKPGNAKAEWKEVHGEGSAHSGKFAVRCITRDDADTSLYQDVPLKLNTQYRLSAWVKTHALKGKVSLNDHIGRWETNKDTAKDSAWNEIEVVFTNKDKPKASINLLHVAKGDGYFDDVKLCEVTPIDDPAEQTLAGDPKRGENLFWNHPVAACKNCHILKGQGSPVGPALDGIAGRKDEAYITESLVNPNAKLAEGYVATPISPMPPMNLILKPQEFADVRAFILSLTEQPKK